MVSCRGVDEGLEGLGLLDPLVLGPPVLEPDLDLGVCQRELIGQRATLLDGQVLATPELCL